jgi:hypothetical protein
MHRTYVHDDGKIHEYFFGPMEATKSTVTAYFEVTPTGGRYYVFEDFLANRFTPNTEKKEHSMQLSMSSIRQSVATRAPARGRSSYSRWAARGINNNQSRHSEQIKITRYDKEK